MNRNVTNYIFIALMLTTLSCSKSGEDPNNGNNIPINYTFTDSRDGQVYGVIELGDQIWMDRNLSYDITTGSSAYYDGDSTYSESYGRLYSWDTAIDAIPSGWHLPNELEWQILINHCGGDSIAGGKLKITGFDNWLFPNTGASNEFGFAALGAGEVNFNTSQGILENTTFWSSTSVNSVSELAFAYKLTQLSKEISKEEKLKGIYCSVRCVRD